MLVTVSFASLLFLQCIFISFRTVLLHFCEVVTICCRPFVPGSIAVRHYRSTVHVCLAFCLPLQIIPWIGQRDVNLLFCGKADCFEKSFTATRTNETRFPDERVMARTLYVPVVLFFRVHRSVPWLFRNQRAPISDPSMLGPHRDLGQKTTRLKLFSQSL